MKLGVVVRTMTSNIHWRLGVKLIRSLRSWFCSLHADTGWQIWDFCRKLDNPKTNYSVSVSAGFPLLGVCADQETLQYYMPGI